MRTNIEIDDGLMAEAMKGSGLKTKKAVVEEALRLLIQIEGQRRILQHAGKVRFWPEVERESLAREKRDKATRTRRVG